MQTKPANIDLRIEELILHDLPYDQRHRVAAAIEQALTRLLAERGLPAGSTEHMPPLRAAPVSVNPRLSAESIGQQVAQSVYAQLTTIAYSQNAAQGVSP